MVSTQLNFKHSVVECNEQRPWEIVQHQITDAYICHNDTYKWNDSNVMRQLNIVTAWKSNII